MKPFYITILLLTIVLFSGCTHQTNTSHPGYPSRETSFDVLPGFKNPPAGYGEVPFYWWMGDTLTKEHLTWHLDLLQKRGVSSLQVNYAHSDKGGRSYGLTFKSKPELFSEEWWELFGWFMKEAKKRNMTVSLSDYTLGVGQNSYVDEALREHPEVTGYELHFDSREFNKDIQWELPETPLSAVIYQLDKEGKVINNNTIDLSKDTKKELKWSAPQRGKYLACVVFSRKKEPSFDPMHPISGKIYIEHFFQKFEDRFPELSKGGINFFFSDELNFQLGNLIWNDIFREEFIKRKEYDITPYLAGLFTDIGDITPKIRLDYNDVMVSLSEENFFKPVYDWHSERGLIYGCDHGGRGRDVTEFGDYFRTQRWNQAPGCDQPHLGRDIIKNKVASSISHLYQRPRVWLEGFYGSGWGTGSDALTDAIFANFTMGHNLLSLHGLYYSTPGGWWEWAPPCNHFRMPYWTVMEPLLRCSERLSFLLSQGVHRADVAILYPTENVVAGYGQQAVQTAFSLAEHLYRQGIDFDFMDYESLQRSEIDSACLNVADEHFRILIIPSMKAIKHASLEKIANFREAGGIVIALGDLPEATDRKGKNDSEVIALINRIFTEDSTSGKSFKLQDNQAVTECINNALPRDFKVLSSNSVTPYVYHRQIGHREIYAVYNVPQGTECFFRCSGEVELWDPWTGNTQPLSYKDSESGTIITMPLTEKEIHLIVFNPGKRSDPKALQEESSLNEMLVLDGPWKFTLKPVLDNRFGDFHWPASNKLIGAEIRQFDYSDNPEQNEWKKQTIGYGAKFRILDGLAQPLNEKLLIENPESFDWKPYEFSWRWGVENDYGHQGYHGLKEEMYDDFIRLGDIQKQATQKVRIGKKSGNHYYLYTQLIAPKDGDYIIQTGELKPKSAYINGEKLTVSQQSVKLKKGNNPLLLYYDQAGTTYFVVIDTEKQGEFEPVALKERPISMRWNGDLSVLPFDARKPGTGENAHFQFQAAPGIQKLIFYAYANKAEVTADNINCQITSSSSRKDGLVMYEAVLPENKPQGAKIHISLQNLINGYTGGALIPYPIEEYCVEGEISCGDWSKQEGLTTYSGGAIYSKEFEWNEQKPKKTILDLGEVASAATLLVNGKEIGTRLAPPYTFDITRYLKKGNNQIEVTVYNTAANHYTTIPTEYRGSTRSGLIGPVKIKAVNK